MTYAEALSKELQESAKVVDDTHYDSVNEELTVGARVALSNDAEGGWNEQAGEYGEHREFDFGVVDTLNEDGTVNVKWDAAQCGCSNAEKSRSEKASDLTIVPQVAVDYYYRGYYAGME